MRISRPLHFLSIVTLVTSHGFLSTPRSRNLVAYQDRIYYPLTSSDPQPEDCPNCLNRGGSLAQCGILHAGGSEERNYDLPKNALGGAMMSNPQGVYTEGAVMDVEVQLTAHHKGHFVFKACPISSTTQVPTKECFDAHPLHFVSDELYGASMDTNHPERVYVAPKTVSNKVLSNDFSDTMLFQYKLKLPENVVGELVLIQWYYVASNSGCVHEGYDTYDWPADWSISGDTVASEWDQKANVGTGLKPCSEVLPEDGDGIPEQFWNCAEVTILKAPTIQQSRPTSTQSKTIIGYYASWQWYDRQKLAKPSNMDFSKVTRVNFAFFQTDKHGNLWGTDSWGDPNVLFGPNNWNPSPTDTKYCSWDTPTTKNCATHDYEKGLIYQVHAAGAEIWPSLGGWSLSDPFPEMTKDGVARMNFAEKCVELIEDYGFDGLDVDWEYPGYEDHSGTPADTENYNLLLRDLRMKLDELGQKTGKFYGLTAALPCGTSNIANIDIETVAQYLTEFNLMTYDFFGAWSPKTGTNAPIYDQDWGDDDVKGFSVDGCVRNWVKNGASPSKINIGLPFYGRSFLKAKELNSDHEGVDKNTWFWDDGSPQYFNIVDKLPELVSVRHEPTKTQYAYRDTSTGGLVSYDDEQAICDKTEYCLDHDLNGFIIWELSGDLMADLSQPLLDTVNNKLIDPALDCKTLAYNPNSVSAGFISEGITSEGITSEGLISEDPVVISQQISVSNLEPKPPTPAPNTLAPTITLYCPDGATVPMQSDGCIGYYYCVYGIPRYPIILCPAGTLFDENSMLCLLPESVTCSGTRSPTSTPTARPTQQPTVFPTRFPILPPSPSPTKSPINPTNGPTSSPSKIPTKVTTDPPVSSTFYLLGDIEQNEPSPSLSSSHIPAAESIRPTDPIQNTLSTPNPRPQATLKPFASPSESSALLSTATQESNVSTSSASVYCPDGYTGVRSTANCEQYFYCIFAVPHLPTIHCAVGKLFDADSKTCMDASRVNCSPDTDFQPNKLARPGLALDSKQPTSSPAKSFFEDGDDSTLDLKPTSSPQSKYNSILDLKPAPTSSPASFLDNTSNSFQQPTSSDSKPLSSLPESLTEVHHKGNASYFFSSPGSSNIPNSLPEDFDLGHPFVTFEIKLNDFPGDIGWQLISLDKTFSVAKPPGTYSSFTPKTTVYESISLQTIMATSASILELKWTILNVKGEGLGGEYFKVYSSSPSEENLLAVGDDFEYTETVGLAVTNEGTILLNENQSEQKYSASEAGDVDTPIAQPGGSFYTDGYQSMPSQDEDKSSMLLPILISLLVVALLAGLFLMILARRTVYNIDEETNFDDLNIEEGESSDFYTDRYSTEEEEPPDSFNGHEANEKAADLDESYHLPTAVSEMEAMMLVAHELSQTPHYTPFASLQPTLFAEENNDDNYGNNVDELLEETITDLEQTSNPDIYSILDKLEEEAEELVF